MAWASITYTFSPSTIIASAEVNQNFDDVVEGLDTAMPTGGIIMWSGAIASIPSGWYLCDGNNGTPNLQDRFIVGAGSGYSVGVTGGASSVTLTSAQSGLPIHGHTMSVNGSDGNTRVRGGGSGTQYSPISLGVNNSSPMDASEGHENRPPYFALAYILKA